MNKPRILYSVPSQTHIALCLDEVEGLEELGYPCAKFSYHAKDGFESKVARLYIIIKNALNLVRIAHHFKPDIIYFNSRLEPTASTRDFITLTIFKSLYRKKVLIMLKSHGSEIGTLSSTNALLKNQVMPYLKKNIGAWLFLSTEEKSKIDKNGYLVPEKVFVTKNIVRAWQFHRDQSFKQRNNIPIDCKILLFVGRIIKEKGIYNVIEAFAKIQETYKTFLIIVGNGSALNDVKQTIHKLGLQEKVILTDRIPEEDVVEYYANSDILVFPTFDQEGFPMALFNSVAAGLSIVTTPIRAATDYLSEPENCLWAEPQNSESVFTALETLLKSEPLSANMKINNIEKGQFFGKERVCEELDKIIETVLKQKN